MTMIGMNEYIYISLYVYVCIYECMLLPIETDIRALVMGGKRRESQNWCHQVGDLSQSLCMNFCSFSVDRNVPSLRNTKKRLIF